MATLQAQGIGPGRSWNRPLQEGSTIVLGRGAGNWNVPWEPFLSRRHVEMVWNRRILDVRKIETARNPIYLRGSQTEAFRLQPGESFVIGQTTFTLINEQLETQPLEVVNLERTYSLQELAKVRYRNADYRLDVLGHLPDVIAGSASDEEFLVRLANMLLAGVRQAEVVAIVAVDHEPSPAHPFRVLYWERRRSSDLPFRPSERLVQDALKRRKQTVFYSWSEEVGTDVYSSLQIESLSWAFCTPIRGDACKGWGIYVTGRFAEEMPSTPSTSDPSDPKDDVKFCELVAAIVGALRTVRSLQRRQANLSQFFSPTVLEQLEDENPYVALEPRECEVSVLFCDLRGFSREVEKHSGGLLEFLERVSKALGVMTSQILDFGGVVGDFQGDAAMGFWGWPIAETRIVERSCQAALGIRLSFDTAARREGHPLAGFRAGIGIATGRAVAGRIGTIDQAKIGVFGPTVNLASRLEGLTKILRAPILIDGRTAELARQQLSQEAARIRRVAIVRPYGVEQPVEVSELLPPASEYLRLTDDHLRIYEEGLDAFCEGRWDHTLELFHQLPPSDTVKDFLMLYIYQNNRQPPAGWDGVIPLTTKA